MPAEAASKLILIVDDDPSTETVLDHIVKREGFRTSLAKDGQEALDRAREQVPDLIIMDLMMPRMGGFEAIRAIQAVCDARVPVVVNTARRIDPEMIVTLRAEANVLEILAKPTDFGRLIQLIHATLGTEPPPSKPT